MAKQTDKTDELVKMAGKAGAEAALHYLEMERKKAQVTRQDRRLYNTKLLLRNYRMLNAYVANAVYEESDDDENAIDILDMMCEHAWKDDVCINSIKKSVMRTQIIMKHINGMLEIYDVLCKRSQKTEDQRRWRVLNAMYISEENSTAEEIAQSEGIDTRTVYKDLSYATEKMTALLFGIDGLKRE
jgi:hypothetical protein